MGEDQIVGPAQDEIDNAKYRNPFELDKFVKERMPDKDRRYYELFGNSEQFNYLETGDAGWESVCCLT